MTDRRAALNTFNEITEMGAYANLAIKKGLSGVCTNNVGRLTALVYCSVEHMNYSDFIIDYYAKGRVQSKIRQILRIAVAELIFMDTPAYTVCNESVKLADEIGKKDLKGFVNGVLRSIARDKESAALPRLPQEPTLRMSIEYGYPQFIIKEYIDEYGVDFADSMLSASMTFTTIRPVAPFTINELETQLANHGVRFERCRIVTDAVRVYGISGGIANDPLFEEGKYAVQSESAMLVCKCLNVKNGMRVLDCCAAPGGKTAYLSQIMDNTGEIISWDVHEHRVQLINAAMKRLHISNVIASTRDASVYCPQYEGYFDAVLCDVPCSGLGGGSKPDARYNRTSEGIDELAKLQYDILSNCSNYVRKGGALVYSTCTISKRENENIISKFIDEHEEFAADDFSQFIPAQMIERCSDGMLQLFPNLDNTDGFFMARMVRK